MWKALCDDFTIAKRTVHIAKEDEEKDDDDDDDNDDDKAYQKLHPI